MHELQRSWVRAQHLSAQWNLGAADEAVLNIVRKENSLVERCNLEWMRLRCSRVVGSSDYQSELCNSPEIL
jgi:hypothetical protein